MRRAYEGPEERTGRGRLIDRRTVVGAAGVIAATGALAGWRLTTPAHAQGDPSALIDLLQFGIICECFVKATLEQALGGPYLNDQDRQFLGPIVKHEEAFANAFRDIIRQAGGTPVEDPDFHFAPEEWVDRETSLRTLSKVVELSVQAWQGQIPTVSNPEVIPRTRPMAMVKARHAAAVALLLGDQGKPLPAAIEPTITLQQFLDAAAPYRGA